MDHSMKTLLNNLSNKELHQMENILHGDESREGVILKHLIQSRLIPC